MWWRLTAAVLLAAAVACTAGGDEPIDEASGPPPTSWVSVASDAVPWTLEAPDDWLVTVTRSRPSPDLITGVLRTWIGTANLQRSWWLGPNSGPGASAKLGPEAVMVEVQLLWSPPDHPIRWSPDPDSELRLERDWGSHADNQNPGWTFHERHLCQGRECISVLTWYGPDASEEDVEDAQRVIESVRLLANWTD